MTFDEIRSALSCGGAVSIPLRARDGSIRAYVIVDEADVDFVTQWRWSLCQQTGYAVRGTEVGGHQRRIYLHRELLGLKHGDERQGDHIDRNYLNCRRENLRDVPHAGNLQNVRSRGGSSAHRGVSWSKQHQKWRAQVQVDGKNRHIGLFADELEASNAARSARERLMPFAVD